MLGGITDWALTRVSRKLKADRATLPLGVMLQTRMGEMRVFDANPQSDKPCVMFVPDGPNGIEHYAALIALLTQRLRVVCFDMPGFGHSLPQWNTTHRLDDGARAVFAVMDALHISKATLAFSCANGFYAIRAAQIAPARVTRLVLTQTPSLGAMRAWVTRIIPWPLRVPVAGQIIAWASRRKMSAWWTSKGPARGTDVTAFQAFTHKAFNQGSCFCLAGIVQGLMRGPGMPAEAVVAPCTLIWGGADRSHKPTLPRSLRKHVAHAEIVQWDDCGHFPELEQPERYARLLSDTILGGAALAAT